MSKGGKVRTEKNNIFSKMDLTLLSKDQLDELFLKINNRYLAGTGQSVFEYMHDPDFLKLREELRQILNELQRRREQG
jgi:hypothetical protein